MAILNITGGGISSGYKKYLNILLPLVSSNPSIHKVLCALPTSFSLNNISQQFNNIRFIDIDPYGFGNRKAKSKLKIILDKFAPDVVYIPVERFFSYEKAPVVIMLQNMEPFVCPFSGNPLSEKLKNTLRIANARKALRRADRIIAISEFVKDFLIKKMCIRSEKIGLVYHGIEAKLENPARPVSVPETCGTFLFTAGSIRPARGLEDVLRALRYLKEQNVNFPLVIAGSVDHSMIGYHEKLRNWIDKNQLSSDVIWAGSLSEMEMAWCYQNCSAFVMTSRVEACPNIVLEAMAHGCINISTETPPMPEFFKDVALYYPAKNWKALGDALIESLSWNDEKKRTMQERAKQRASQFSWDICAEKTVEQFTLAIEEFKRGNKG